MNELPIININYDLWNSLEVSHNQWIHLITPSCVYYCKASPSGHNVYSNIIRRGLTIPEEAAMSKLNLTKEAAMPKLNLTNATPTKKATNKPIVSNSIMLNHRLEKETNFIIRPWMIRLPNAHMVTVTYRVDAGAGLERIICEVC
jgi:hypothetical protein